MYGKTASRTNTPLQALTLLNDPVYVAAAQGLAHRVRVERSSAPLEQQIAYAFQLCVARLPNEREQESLESCSSCKSQRKKEKQTSWAKNCQPPMRNIWHGTAWPRYYSTCMRQSPKIEDQSMMSPIEKAKPVTGVLNSNWSRRNWLGTSRLGFGSLALAAMLRNNSRGAHAAPHYATHFAPRAKQVIYLHMIGTTIAA